MSAPTIAARPTRYRGIQMRSRLEAKFAAGMDDVGWDWLYEPQCFADGRSQYLPDFLVCGELTVIVDSFHVTDEGVYLDAPGREVATLTSFYVEVRPPTARGSEDIKRHAQTIWASEPTAAYLRWLPQDGHEAIDGIGVLCAPSSTTGLVCLVNRDPKPNVRVIRAVWG